MKLTEITASSTEFTTYDDKSIQQAQSYMNNTVDNTISLEGGQYELKITSDNYFALFKHESLIGWTKLEPTRVKGTRYYSLDVVYLIPSVRKTKALMILINAIKNQLSAPVIIKGTVFKDGMATLIALTKRDGFRVNFINIKTGDITDFDGVISSDVNKAIIISGTN